MLTAYSAVATLDIPASAEIVFGYANPPFSQLEEIAEHLPHARIVPIVTHGSYIGEMYDFESGALNPEDAGAVITEAIHRGIRRPICYYALTNHDAIVKSLKTAHIGRREVRLCPAHWTATPELPDWADGVQWGGAPLHTAYNIYELRENFFHGHDLHLSPALLTYQDA